MTQKTKLANVVFRIIIFLGLIASIVGITEIILISIKEGYSSNDAVIYEWMASNLLIWMISFMALTVISVLAFIFNFVSHKATNTVSYIFRTIIIFFEALSGIVLCTVAYALSIVAAVVLGYLPIDKVFSVKDYVNDVDMLETLILILVIVTGVSFVIYLILSITSIVSLHKMSKKPVTNTQYVNVEQPVAPQPEVVEQPVVSQPETIGQPVAPQPETVEQPVAPQPEAVEQPTETQNFSGFNNN